MSDGCHADTETPSLQAVKNFTELANRGYYNDTTIHRIIPGEIHG